MKIKPLHDKILVRRAPEETQTKSGLYIPASAKEKPTEGVVLAVGPGKLLEDGSRRALEVSAGDRILFTKYAGTEIKVEGAEVLILSEEDVLGVVDA